MVINYRYPGAKPFATEQQSIFFGRQQDIGNLKQIISLEGITLLHSKSGIGKSSLINAGLIPKLQEENSLIPYVVRFGAFLRDEINFPTPVECILPLFNEGSLLLDKVKPTDDNSLWYYFKSKQINSTEERYKGVILIFDQFEELFTYPLNHIKDFAQQISELIFTNIPTRYRDRIEKRLAEDKTKMTERELSLIHEPMEVKLLLVMRSDRLSFLSQIHSYLPTVFENLYELKPLDRLQAEDAILYPAFDSGDFFSPVFDYEDEAVDHILDFFSRDNKEDIESFQLQIICEYIEQNLVLKEKKRLIEKSDLINLENVLENYYLNKISEIEPERDMLAARKLIEEGLIFEEEERRLSIYEGQIRKNYGIDSDLLSRLLNTHLIRSEPSVRGGFAYELSHDTLVAPVLKAKSYRVAEEEIRIEEARRIEKEKELEIERKRTEYEIKLRKAAEFNSTKAKQNSRLAVVIALLAIFFASFAFWQFRMANINKLLALDAMEKAVKSEKEARESLNKFQQAEAEKVISQVKKIIDSAQKLPSRYNDEKRMKLEEALSILGKYPNNLELSTFKDSIIILNQSLN